MHVGGTGDGRTCARSWKRGDQINGADGGVLASNVTEFLLVSVSAVKLQPEPWPLVDQELTSSSERPLTQFQVISSRSSPAEPLCPTSGEQTVLLFSGSRAHGRTSFALLVFQKKRAQTLFSVGSSGVQRNTGSVFLSQKVESSALLPLDKRQLKEVTWNKTRTYN